MIETLETLLSHNALHKRHEGTAQRWKKLKQIMNNSEVSLG